MAGMENGSIKELNLNIKEMKIEVSTPYLLKLL
jgi:hypothetical protein